MAATQYISKWQGIDIDAAVSFYQKIGAKLRSVIKVSVVVNNWKSTSDTGASPTEKQSHGSYYIDIKGTGDYNIKEGEPIIYFIQTAAGSVGEAGQQWNLDYVFKTESDTAYARVYSNVKLQGDIVVMATLSDTESTAGAEILEPQS